MELMPASFREWTEILARIRIGKVRAAGKAITGTTVKAVAARYASYGDSNGTRIHPGVARVAIDLEMDCRTVKTALAYLRGAGLIELVRPGGRRGADEYRLTLPTDLLDREDLTVWSPTEQRAEIERLAEGRRGNPKPPPNGPNGGGSQGPQAPVIEPESRGPLAPEITPITGASGARSSPIMGASGAQSRGPQAPATYQDRYTTTATDHSDGDLRTDVTGSRARADPEPQRCPDHLMRLQPRTDGLNPCPLCRAGAPPTAEAALADVIPLKPRRLA